MPGRVFYCLVFILFCLAPTWAQKAHVTGFVKDAGGAPLDSVIVAYEATGLGSYVYTDKKGYYYLEVPAAADISIIAAYPGLATARKKLHPAAGETATIDFILKESNELKAHTVKAEAEYKRIIAGNVKMLDPSKIPFIPGTIGGVETLIKLATGSHDELTSQYSVRGGNFDENLVYVNDFEVYRPFLVRTGQQEGLSFVNSDLVSNVNFSVGGFESKYGDKLSSVLDVSYKRPTEFGGSVTTSLLGASMHLEGISKNRKLTYLFGARQKSNQYLLQAQPTQGVYNPSFSDIQAIIDYKINERWDAEFIGNYARNRFTFFPESQTTSFGVLNQAYQLQVFYYGSELDQFDSRFGGLSTSYHSPNEKFKLKFLASGFQTNEYETYDIQGQYLFGNLQTDLGQKNFGQISSYLGAGTIQNFARNYLDVSVEDLGVRGSYDYGKSTLLFGTGANLTDISSQLHQWMRVDSAGFTQPYNPNALHLTSFYNTNADFNYVRANGFVQDNFKLDSAGSWLASAGTRFNYSFLNGEFLFTPRTQLAYVPKWKRDWVFKASAGMYAQPAHFREMVSITGVVNTGIKAQQSAQAVLGGDNNFTMYNRPFKFTGEVYYKYLWNLDPYIYNNVSIEYTGKNDAVGYIYGGELRLYGDLVKDATSWISIGIMKASQRITDSSSLVGYKNYFPLPSDQRFMLGMYFEDYLKQHKNFKVHINMMYATGLPTGPPVGHLYDDNLRLPDYKRVDIGFSALLLDSKRKEHPAHSYFNYLKTIWASVEVFNLLDIQNTLSYSWIQDDSSQRIYAVPNRLTSRLLNLKVLFRF